jgi:hypothetical protein
MRKYLLVLLLIVGCGGKPNFTPTVVNKTVTVPWSINGPCNGIDCTYYVYRSSSSCLDLNSPVWNVVGTTQGIGTLQPDGTHSFVITDSVSPGLYSYNVEALLDGYSGPSNCQTIQVN